MKLRQKLAVVLATAMVATAVPVVTMADADVTVKKTGSVVEKDTFSTGAALKIKFKDHDTSDGNKEIFYMTFENAKWDDDALNAAMNDSDWFGGDANFTGSTSSDEYTYVDGDFTVTVEKQKDKVYKVTVETATAADFDNDYKVTIPLITKLTGGSATVTVAGEGGKYSTLGSTEKTYSFASTGEDSAQVIVGSVKNFYKKGKIAEITFKDTYTNSISGKDFEIELELEDPDYSFYDIDNIKVEGSYGYNTTLTLGQIKNLTGGKAELSSSDKGLLKITIPAGAFGTADSTGRLTLKNVWVKTNEKEPSTGDFKIKVSGKNDTDLVDGGSLVVGKVVNYSNYIEMEDEKTVEIKAGREEDVTFKVGEYLDDCFTGGRDLEITLDNENTYFMIDSAFVQKCVKESNDNFVFTYQNDKSLLEDIITDSEKDLEYTVESVQFVWDDDYAPSDVYKQGESTLIAKADAENTYVRATGIIVTMSKVTDGDGKNINTNGKEDWFQVETSVYVPVDQKDAGTIKLKAEGHAMAEEAEADAVVVKNPFDVTIEATTLKVGLQGQVGGKITIAETDKEQLEKGKLYLDVASEKKGAKGIEIEEVGTLTVTGGDMKKTDFTEVDDLANNQVLEVEIKRQSSSAATLEIADPAITVDRSVPEGAYDLKLSGDAIDKYDGELKIKDFIVIGTSNTQDLTASNGLVKGTASFKIGETKYTAIDGTEVTMDAASYIQDPGYTMVPVKYVALAFGITEDCISYSNGKIAIVTGSKAIGLERGSNIAVVNGVQVPMSTKVTIKDGRTYAPIADVAKILGITPAWDSATKTATFTNK